MSGKGEESDNFVIRRLEEEGDIWVLELFKAMCILLIFFVSLYFLVTICELII